MNAKPAAMALRLALAAALLLPGLAQAAKLREHDSGWNPPPVIPPVPGETLPTIAELEARGAVIGQVFIRVFDVFDPTIKGEDNWLYRTANKLHINTKEATVRARLTFHEGEPVSHVRLEESERSMRGQRYVYDAIVRPVRYDAATNTVDIEVSIRDVWTLNPGISFSSSGGANRERIELEELNLFGWGKRLQLAYTSDDERTQTELQWVDPNILGSRWRMDTSYADLSDGTSMEFTLERPFYSLDSRWATGVDMLDDDRIVTRYSEADPYDGFRTKRRSLAPWFGWSQGLKDGWTRRWFTGWTFDEARFEEEPGVTPPPELSPERELSYPFIGLEWLEDAYGKARNQDQIMRTEDVYLGLAARVSMGMATTALGSTQDAAILKAAVQGGRDLTPKLRIIGNAQAATRVESGELANASLSAQGQHYWRFSDKQVFYASLTGTVTDNLDIEQQLFLGAEQGLRGYRNRFQSGTSSALATIEYRLYTDWFPFRLFYVGGAAFLDAGRTWGRDPAGVAPLGLLKDIGIGLRFGSARSGLGNVLHVDFAYALDAPPGEDKFQINIKTKKSF
ncbi:MAG: BamA/TamA family outer membrane protein [Gammaproteobacteria bacterium]|nr:BamA/TamA family outer membrane protein [Gammaproteobacteria bacterium]